MKRDKFFGESTRDALDELSDNAMNRERAKLEQMFLVFYDKSLEYFSRWFKYVDDLKGLAWLRLEDPSFEYNAVSASYRTYTDGGPAGRNLLYAEFTELKASLGKLRGTAFDNLSVPQKWVQLLRSENIVQIRILVGALMSIFPSNAYCESVFSMVNGYWPPQKSMLQVDTVNAVISLKCNCDFSCVEAYKYFLNDPTLLAEARTNAKDPPRTASDNL